MVQITSDTLFKTLLFGASDLNKIQHRGAAALRIQLRTKNITVNTSLQKKVKNPRDAMLRKFLSKVESLTKRKNYI